MDRDEIRKLAECHGLWAHEIWWKQNIPRFDGIISEVQAPLLKRIAELESQALDADALTTANDTKNRVFE